MRVRLTCGLALLLTTFLPSRHSLHASVIMSLTDQSASSASANPGATFPVRVSLQSTSMATSDQVVGVDYELESFNAMGASVSSIFTIETANRTSSPFSDLNDPNAPSDNGGGLNPENPEDLGGSVPQSNYTPVDNTTVDTGDYTLMISPTAPLGMYTINLIFEGNAGGLYQYNTTPFATDATPNSVQPLTINVISAPEPSTVALLGLGVIGAMLRRRRKMA